MTRIPPDEVRFHPHSFFDEAGRLFRWRGELYRAIYAKAAPFFSKIATDGTFQSLSDSGLLIKTEVAPLALDGFEMVLRHRTVPFVSYPHEWCAEMLNDAALIVLELIIALSRRGLTLKDAHPWNVLFDGCKPVWVDATSIIVAEKPEQWPALDEFHRFFLHPLILMSEGHERVARWLMSEPGGAARADLLPYISPAANSLLRPSRREHFSAVLRHYAPEFALRRAMKPFRADAPESEPAPGSLIEHLEQIQEEVEALRFPTPSVAEEEFPGVEPLDSWSAEQKAVLRIFAEQRPQTTLIIGSAWHAKLASNFSKHVVAFDTRSEEVTGLFEKGRALNLSLLPLVMNFAKPTPAVGLGDHFFVSAAARLRCDLILAPGIVEQLVFEYGRFGFDEIAEGLAQFSSRWAVVDFTAPSESRRKQFPWYTAANLETALLRHYPLVHRVTESEARILLFCDKGVDAKR